MQGNDEDLNLHEVKAVMKNMLQKLWELNLKYGGDHESKYFFLKKEDQIFKISNRK